MLSTEFPFYFKELKTFYLGCFSSDNYPKTLKRFEFFVVNKDSSNEKGSHWMLVFLSEKEIEFFDSCGTNEQFVKTFLKFNQRKVCVFNETCIQPSSSNTCGEFCIYFAFKRLLNRDQSFASVINKSFSLDLEKNNFKVIEFCKNLFQKNVEFGEN